MVLQKKKMITLGILLVGGVVCLGALWWYWMRLHYVSTDDARIGGTIQVASSKIPGRVIELLADEGDEVTEGQVIARLDDTESRANVDRIEAQLSVHKALVTQAEAHLHEAEAHLLRAGAEWKRVSALFKEGMVSSSRRDETLEAYQSAQDEKHQSAAALQVAQARVKEMEASLAREKEILEETVIRTMHGSFVARKSAEEGEVVQPGQPIMTIVELDDVWVEARVEETDIGRVTEGQRATIRVDAYPGVSFEGGVLHVGAAAASVFSLIPTENPAGTFVKVTQRIPVRISIERKGHILRPGMSVVVRIRVKE